MYDICWHKNRKQIIGACLINTENVFGAIWMDGMIFKILAITIHRGIVSIFHSMRYDRVENDVKRPALQGKGRIDNHIIKLIRDH